MAFSFILHGFTYKDNLKLILSTLLFLQGDEALSKSMPVTVDDDDDDNDPENRYDSICKDFKKIITHPRCGHKQQQGNHKQV